MMTQEQRYQQEKERITGLMARRDELKHTDPKLYEAALADCRTTIDGWQFSSLCDGLEDLLAAAEEIKAKAATHA